MVGDGTFDMSGGTISENTANGGSVGGGVRVLGNGTFKMTSGLIFGSGSTDNLIYHKGLEISGNSIIIAWDKSNNTTYYENTNTGINVKNADDKEPIVYWSGQSEKGIAY